MVALLVAIAVVFVSRFFSVLTDLDLDLDLHLSSPSPPLPLTHISKQTSHTDYLSLIFLATIRL